MPEFIVVLGLGFTLLAVGAWLTAQKHGAECDRCQKGDSYEQS